MPFTPSPRHTERHDAFAARLRSLKSLLSDLESAAGLGLAAGGCAYAALWPASQLFGPTLIAPPRPGELALTFDDGPNPAWTPRLLDLLASHDVRATFFLVGSRAQAEPALVRQIAAAGHLIGNHSWSHPNLALASASRIEQELSRTSQTLEADRRRADPLLPPALRRAPPRGPAHRKAPRPGSRPLERHDLRLEKPVSGRNCQPPHSAPSTLSRRGRAANIVLHDGSHLSPAANRAPSIAAAAQLIANYKPTSKFVTLEAWV